MEKKWKMEWKLGSYMVRVQKCRLGSVFSSEGLKGSGNLVSSCKGGINRLGLARGLKSPSGKLLTKSLEPSAVEFESGFWF